MVKGKDDKYLPKINELISLLKDSITGVGVLDFNEEEESEMCDKRADIVCLPFALLCHRKNSASFRRTSMVATSSRTGITLRRTALK